MISTFVDTNPFQAIKVAAESPQDLPRFLAGLTDTELALIGALSELLVRDVQRAHLARRFAKLWHASGESEMSSWFSPYIEAAVEEDSEQTQIVPASCDYIVEPGTPFYDAPADDRIEDRSGVPVPPHGQMDVTVYQPQPDPAGTS